MGKTPLCTANSATSLSLRELKQQATALAFEKRTVS